MALDPGEPAVRAAAVPERNSGSLRKELEEPAWSNHLGPQGLSPPPQLAIRGDECDHLIRDVRDDINEGVVTATGGVEDRDAVSDSVRDALSSPAFQDDDYGLGDPSRVDGSSYLGHESSGRSCSIPPPAGRTRPDHIRRVNEKHNPSLIVGSMAGRLRSPEMTSSPLRLIHRPLRKINIPRGSRSTAWKSVHPARPGPRSLERSLRYPS
jgi:hypothetical protein